VTPQQVPAYPFPTSTTPFFPNTFPPQFTSEVPGAFMQPTPPLSSMVPSAPAFATPTTLLGQFAPSGSAFVSPPAPAAPATFPTTAPTAPEGIFNPPAGSATGSQFPRPPNWIPFTFDNFNPTAPPASSAPAKHAPKHREGPVKITYFGLKARAFLPMLVAEVGNVPYEWNKVEMEDWPTLKPHTPFGQVPIMEHGDIMIGQSLAIAAYIGRLAGLLGEEDADFAMSQMLLAQCEDMMSAMGKAFYTNNKAEEMPKFFAEKVPSDLEKLEKLVSGGFTNERTIGELAIFSILNIFLDMQPDCLDAFPALTAFYKHLAADPKISAFLETKAGGLWYKRDW
jgi:glutathione S-transferase